MEAHWSKSPHPKMVPLLSVLCRLYPWISMASRIKEQLHWIGNVLVGSNRSSSYSQQKTSQQADSVNFQSWSLRGRWGAFTHILSSSVHLCLPAWTEFHQVWLCRFGGKQLGRGGKWKSSTVSIVSCMPVWLPGSGEVKHGGDFVRLVPPEASGARKLYINKTWCIC